MEEKRAAAYRRGWIAVIVLAAFTLAEYFVAVSLNGSLALLMIIALIKAAIIVQVFMHISRLWREEDH